MKNGFREIQLRVTRFAAVIRWLAVDGFRQFPLRLPLSVAFSLGGFGLTVGTLGLLALYAHHIESASAIVLGGSLAVPEILIEPRERSTLYVVAVFCGLGIAGGAFLKYYSESVLLRVAVQYEAFCARRAAAKVSRLPVWMSHIGDEELTSGFAGKAVGGDSRICGRALRSIAEGAVAPIALSALVGTLCWLDLALTLQLGVVGAVMSPLVLISTARTGELSRQLERSRVDAMSDRRLLRSRMGTGTGPTNQEHRFYHDLFTHGKIRRSIEIFGERLIAIRRASMMTFIVFGALLFVAVLQGADGALSGERSWTAFITYLLLMRLSLGYLVSLTGAMAQLARFYPSIRRHHVLATASSAETALDLKAPQTAGKARWSTSPTGGPCVTRGSRIAVVQFGPVTRYAVSAVAQAMEPDLKYGVEDLFRSVAVLNGDAPLGGGTLRESYGIPQAVPIERILSELQWVGACDIEDTVTEVGLDKKITSADIRRLPKGFTAKMQAVTAIHRDVSAIVCSAAAAQSLGEGMRERLFSSQSEALIIMVYGPNIPRAKLMQFGEQAVMVIDGGQVLAWMQKSEAGADLDVALLELSERHTTKQHAAGDSESDADEDDDS